MSVSNHKVPLTKDDLRDGSNALPIPESTLQLQVDTLNVIEGRVSLSTFPEDYRKKILNYYRFSAHFTSSKYYKIAKRKMDTLEII